jgi:type IV pilus assembly protein PilM
MFSMSSLSSKLAFPKMKKNGHGLVGLDIGSSKIKIAEVRAGRKGYELVNVAQIELMPDTIVDGQIIDGNHVSDCISSVFAEQGISSDQIATSLSGNAVIVKKISLPAMGPEELREQIHWEAQQHIPFDINDVNLDYHVLDSAPGGEAADVLLVACKKDMVSQLTQVIATAGKTAVIVDVDAFALQNAYEINYRPEPTQTVMLLNVGASVTNINIVRGSSSVFTRDVSMGGNQYTDTLQKRFNLSFEDAEMLKRGVRPEGCEAPPAEVEETLNSVTEMLASEIQRTLDFFYQQMVADHEPLVGVLVAGGGSKVSNLIPHMAERFGVHVEAFDPFRSLSVNGQKFDEAYLREYAPDMAVAVGLALRSAD